MPRGYSSWSILLLLALAVAVSSGTANHTYNIYPACADNNSQCLTLLDIARASNEYFISNATLVFSPGDHNLQEQVVSITNISGLTLMSSNGSEARMSCGNSSFSFSTVSELQLVSISFISCRFELSSTTASFQDCWFENSTASVGGAVAVYSGSQVHFYGRIGFVGNEAWIGGAIFANNSNLTFFGDSSFIGNTAAVVVQCMPWSTTLYGLMEEVASLATWHNVVVQCMRRITIY